MRENRIPTITLIGLILAFLGTPMVIFGFNYFLANGPLTDSLVVAREISIFLSTALLILIVLKGERLGLDSIGLHNRHWGKSILWGLLVLLICIAAGLICVGLLGLVGISYGDGTESRRYDDLSLVTMSLVVLRAGIVEEICYRGYIIERLEKLSGKWVVYVLLPAIIFGLLHYRQGPGGILISFVIGLVLAIFYLRTRDLKANIIGHFLVDFIPNVLAPLFEGKSD